MKNPCSKTKYRSSLSLCCHSQYCLKSKLYHSKKMRQKISQIKEQITQIRTQIREEAAAAAAAAAVAAAPAAAAAQTMDGEEPHHCSQEMSRMRAAQKMTQIQAQGQQEMGTEEA